MQCQKCGRLNYDDTNVCRFCGNVFDESKPAEPIVPNNHIVYEIDSDVNIPKRNPYKSGIIFLIVCAAVIVAVILLIVYGTSYHGAKSAVKDYAAAYYSGDFYETYDNSSVDLNKVYEAQANAGTNDIFGGLGDIFGNMFGFSGGYSSYDQMVASYLQSFEQIHMQRYEEFGSGFKINVKIKETEKLKNNKEDTIKASYLNSCADIIKDGNIQNIYRVDAVIQVKGNSDAQQKSTFYVIKIDGDYYVLTDSSLNPYLLTQ